MARLTARCPGAYQRDPNFLALAEDLESGSSVVFIGAGVSAAAGLPSWPELVDRMRHRAQLRKSYSPLRTADICRQVLGIRSFNKLVTDQLEGRPVSLKLHEQICKLPSNLFATTNFDTLLEQAMGEVRQARPLVISLNARSDWLQVPDQPTRPWVLKLHGCVERCRDRLILSEEDYLGFASAYPTVSRGTEEILARHPVLFLGYSMSDWDILGALQFVRRAMEGDSPNAYFAAIGAEIAERRYLEQRYGLRVLELAQGDVELSGNEKTEVLSTFVADLSKRFLIPEWLRNAVQRLGGRIDRSPGVLDANVTALFPDHDITATIRLCAKVQSRIGLSLPLERVVGGSFTVRELIQRIRS